MLFILLQFDEAIVSFEFYLHMYMQKCVFEFYYILYIKKAIQIQLIMCSNLELY